MERFGDGSSNHVLEMPAASGIGGFGSKWYRSRWMIEGWYKKAEDGDAEAQYELGRQLMSGTDYGAFKRSTKEGIKYYEMAAAQGAVDAMFNLASTYQYGWSDLEPDAEKEFYWRKKAADAGNTEACYLTGKMYIEGRGAYEDFEQGLQYLKVAAESKDAGDKMTAYYNSVCRVEKIYQENKDEIVPVNSDFYVNFEGDDRLHLQEYLNRIMYDLICAMKADDGEYVFSTFNHIITLIELAVWASRPVVQMISEEHTYDELELLVTRMLYHYIDAIGEKEFYDHLSNCTKVD